MFYEKKTKKLEYMALPRLAPPSFIHFHNEVEILVNMGSGAKANIYINAQKYCIENLFDAVLITPGHVHSSETLSEGLFMAFIFPAEYVPKLYNTLMTKQPTSPFFNLKELGVDNILMDFWTMHTDAPANVKHVRSSVVVGYMNLLLAHLSYKLDFSPVSSDISLVNKVVHYLTENYGEQITLKEISNTFGISHPVISKAFNSATGITIPSFINWIRASAAAELLTTTDETITAISGSVGFRTIRNFNRSFVEFYGTTPSEYRKSQRVV